MKKVILTTLILFSLNTIFAQQINPSNEDEYCPETYYNFIIYISGDATNPAPTFFVKNSLNYIPDNVNATYNGGITTISFRAKFNDVNNTQTIVFNYKVSGQAATTKDFDFKSIKSLLHADPRTSPYPVPSSILAERCKSQTWSISFPNTQYINPFLNAREQKLFGSITQYEYSLPQGWSLNGGTPVTGPADTRIAGNNVTITSDLSHGVNSAIYIRPLNSCNTALAKNNYGVISISRPAPTLAISGPTTICNAAPTQTYTVTGLTNGATVAWQVGNPIIATPNPTTGTSTTITKNGEGVTDVRAIVTDCIGTYPVIIKPITLGTPPISISAIKSSSYGEPTTYDFTATNIPGASYRWYVNNVVISGENFYTFDWYFPCKVSKTIKGNYINACGVSNTPSSYTFKGECIRAQAHRFAINRNLITANLLTIKVAQLSEDLLNKYYFGEVPLANEQVVHVRVYNKEGYLLQESDGTGGSQLDLDISNYAEGTYNVEVTGQGDYRELQTYYLTGLSTTEGSIAEAIATGSIIISDIQHDARLYVMQQSLYYNLQYDREFMNSSSILTDFAHTTGQGSFGAMFRIDEALFNGDYIAAQDLLNNFTTTNTVDENYKAYYELYLRYINADVFDVDDLSDLYAIAEKCPLTDGEIVYAARSLYNLLSQSTETFTYACGGIGLRTANPNFVQSQQPTLIYPNPSNGQFTVTFAPTKKGYNTVNIFDALGKQVATQSVSANVGKINLNLKLVTGLYIVKTTNIATGKTETQKLIIQ